MQNIYRETFEQIHASEQLRKEVEAVGMDINDVNNVVLFNQCGSWSAAPAIWPT